MPRSADKPVPLTRHEAVRHWLHAQRLDTAQPFGSGAQAVPRAVAHLGYVQIDTINVIERCHHHILYSRIPDYRRADLHRAQSTDKSVFEYWTHALAYIPTQDFRFFAGDMARHRRAPNGWFSSVTKKDLRKVLTLIRENGPLTIRDIEDDVLVEKIHPWASRKPSKRALQLAFYDGIVTISERAGMLKTYELLDRHFGWDKRPKPASEREVAEYLLERALRAQAIVSLESICHLDASRKPAVRRVIEARVRRGDLIAVTLEGTEKAVHWMQATLRDMPLEGPRGLVHLLSPFDPLVIQRKRLQLFFGYEHRFEAHVPKHKRVLGYFALPVLVDDAIVAAIDLKADRTREKLLIQKWTWIGRPARRALKPRIEEALHRFQHFQFADA